VHGHHLQDLFLNTISLSMGPLAGADSAACPRSRPARPRSQLATALAVVAGPGSAARLEGTIHELLAHWSRARDDVRGMYHVYIVVVRWDPLVGNAGVCVHATKQSVLP
jgi:hypothetical protein